MWCKSERSASIVRCQQEKIRPYVEIEPEYAALSNVLKNPYYQAANVCIPCMPVSNMDIAMIRGT